MKEIERQQESVQEGSIKVNEIFYSLQGEGPQLGTPSWFIRLSGCNLNCSWCDSKYASEGAEMILDDIVNAVSKNNCKNIVITGGEPLIQNILPLLKKLQSFNVSVETNGTIFKSELIGYCKYIVSPKIKEYKGYLNQYYSTLSRWSIHATFKFVIGDHNEFNEAIQVIKFIKPHYPVYFMPKATNEKTMKDIMLQLTEWVKNEYPHVIVCPRLQIYLYGNKRGT